MNPDGQRPSPPQNRAPDDWDIIDRITKRCWRAILVGLPTWIVLLAAFSENVTGIPLQVGFTIATLLTIIVVVAVDLAKRDRTQRASLGKFGLGTIVWVIAFTILALILSRGGDIGLATVLIPFLGATLVAVFVVFAVTVYRASGSSSHPPRRR